MAKLSDLIAQAQREPYQLELADGTTVSVPQPTVAEWRAACAAANLGGILTGIGVSTEDAERVQAELDTSVFGAETAVLQALRNYFRLGNS